MVFFIVILVIISNIILVLLSNIYFGRVKIVCFLGFIKCLLCIGIYLLMCLGYGGFLRNIC